MRDDMRDNDKKMRDGAEYAVPCFFADFVQNIPSLPSAPGLRRNANFTVGED